MPSKPIHIIQKQSYDVAVPSERYGMQLQQDLQQMNLNYIMPAMSNKLDELFSGDNVVVIDRLEINIGKIKSDLAPQDWVEKILAGLETSVKLMGLSNPGNEVLAIRTESRAEHAIKTWLHFLTAGMLPADSTFKSVDELKQVLFSFNQEDRISLKTGMLLHEVSPGILQRLALANDKELLFFIQLLMPSVSSAGWDRMREKIKAEIHKTAEEKKLTAGETTSSIQNKIVVEMLQEIWLAAKGNKIIEESELQKLAAGKLESLFAKMTSKETSQEKTEQQLKDKIVKEHADKEEDENEEVIVEQIFVNNAGLCLLAPYLGMFFKAMEMCDDNQFLSKAKQQHAIYLVHYLATGELNAPEEQLVFAKLLCGWPLQMPCVNEQPITDHEISEATELLVSVISHWSVLKNTSPEGLREAFLQRSGKLVTEADQYILQVEQQSIDILLDSIPWTFRMMRLPWMRKMVRVEWY